jgi:hypothetical protein
MEAVSAALHGDKRRRASLDCVDLMLALPKRWGVGVGPIVQERCEASRLHMVSICQNRQPVLL